MEIKFSKLFENQIQELKSTFEEAYSFFIDLKKLGNIGYTAGSNKNIHFYFNNLFLFYLSISTHNTILISTKFNSSIKKDTQSYSISFLQNFLEKNVTISEFIKINKKDSKDFELVIIQNDKAKIVFESFYEYLISFSKIDKNDQMLVNEQHFSNFIVGETTLISTLDGIVFENAKDLYILIDKLISELKIEEGDVRVHYNCKPKEFFNITIGRRYCIEHRVKHKDFGVILPKQIDIPEEKIGFKFNGQPEAIFLRTQNFNEILNYENDFIQSCEKELKRTTISGFRKSTNLAFEKSVFDLEYRNELFNQVFEQDFNAPTTLIDEANLISTLKGIEYENANNLFILIDKLISELKINEGDVRVHYNCKPNDNFNITVGQRYAIRLNTKKLYWDIIIPKETDVTENNIGFKFSGKPETISYRTNNFIELKLYEKEFIEASLGELNRTTISGFRKLTNLAFEKSVFDLEYRNELFNQVFEQVFSKKIALNENTEIKKINIPLNQILFGPPGTGKTYHTINKAVEIADNDFYNQNKKNRTELKRRFKELKENNQIVFTTFHQSMSYEEFLESLKPFEKDEKIYYKIEDGIFKQICEKASQTKRMSITIENKEVEFTKEILQDLYSGYVENLPDQKNEISEIILSTTEGAHFQLFKNSANSIVVKAGEKKANMSVSSNELINIYFENKIPAYKSYAHKIFEDILSGKNFKKIDNDNSKKNFVLIIDEINRGNIASIFGELITLIEDDKRKGEEEELSVKLPYSKQDFTVPKNLYIIGTMNTADRSVEALDSALRRRFVFNEMQPDETLLKKDFYGINLQEVLKWINLRIEKLIDKDHKIGHSYFMNLETEIDLQNAFKNKIIPLLEEYFYGDFAKIGLVLGVDFVSKNNFEENIFKKIENFENYTDFENRIIYKTTVPESIDEFINAVKNIYL